MDVLFLNPVYPVEMQDFARGLATVGARVLGVGETPAAALPAKVKAAVHDYLQVPRLLDEDDLVRRVRAWVAGRSIARVESCWEPLVLAAARLREELHVPGMSVDTVRGFRDKQLMKERVAAAGVRVPRAARVRTADEARAAANIIGFPLILKPIAGAGSADTWRVEDAGDLERVLGRMGHVREASCEEFVDGDEYTYDTITINGEPHFQNVAQYLPRPLVARTEHWISPVILTFRDLNDPRLQDGIALGRTVLRALGMERGFTHMEWYRKRDGEVVFGEIGCRPGGARLVDQMNVGSDADLFVEWARAVVHGEVRVSAQKPYHTAIIFKRAEGSGIIRHIDGLERFLARHRDHVMIEDLLKPGQARRDWKQTLLSDGFLLIRHADERGALEIAHEAARTIRLWASS